MSNPPPIEKHLDDSLEYWKKMYSQTEERANRLSAASGIFSAFLAKFFLERFNEGEMVVFSLYGASLVLGILETVLIFLAAFFALVILLPATSAGTKGIQEMRRKEEFEEEALEMFKGIPSGELKRAIQPHANSIFWTNWDSTDTEDSFVLRSKLVCLLHFRKMSSIRAKKATLSIYCLSTGIFLLTIAFIGALIGKQALP